MFETEENKWPEIALIGSYPPPYGGISVHLQRLVERMKEDGVDFRLYNTLSKSQQFPYVVSVADSKVMWYLRFCLSHRCKIVHLVSTSWLSRVMFGIMACLRSGKYVLSIHGRSISEKLRSHGLQSRLTRWFLRRMDAVIACNPDIERECIEDIGLDRRKVSMVPAFIPPNLQQAGELPNYVKEFVASHTPRLCAVGWIGSIYKGEEVYGTDMMVELVERLKADYPDIGLILSLNGGDETKIEQFIKNCRRRLSDSMLVIAESLKEVSPVIRDCDVFVRPTNTDGDSVSIREALYLGTPVVSSDAVPRPEECVLFRNRCMDDFEEKVRYALSNLHNLKASVKACKMPDNAGKVLEIYKNLKERAT
ncbi:MAG: glycosyltransferase family 4 protein [Sedimentisphaerales bacterium]|jgi:glycosyltransferase involved in cell wall biosynthesis